MIKGCREENKQHPSRRWRGSSNKAEVSRAAEAARSIEAAQATTTVCAAALQIPPQFRLTFRMKAVMAAKQKLVDRTSETAS